MSRGLRPGEVAAAAGVGRETLRYYERRGLIAPAERTVGGHRVYSPDAVDRLRAVKAAQKLGFTLDEIERLTDPHHHRRRPDGGLQEGTRAKLAQVQARIAELESVAALLQAALEAGCDDLDTCAHTPNCPLPFPETPQPNEQTRP